MGRPKKHKPKVSFHLVTWLNSLTNQTRRQTSQNDPLTRCWLCRYYFHVIYSGQFVCGFPSSKLLEVGFWSLPSHTVKGLYDNVVTWPLMFNQPRTWVGLFMRKFPCGVCPRHTCWVGVGEVNCLRIYIVNPNCSQRHKVITGGVEMKLSTVVKGT